MQFPHELACEYERQEPREQDCVIDRERQEQKAAEKIKIYDDLQKGQLTFELRRDQRQDAGPECIPYRWHGPGGLPLGLASNEGLGVTVGGCDIEVKYVLSSAQLGVQGNCCVVAVIRLHEDDVDAALGRSSFDPLDHCCG